MANRVAAKSNKKPPRPAQPAATVLYLYGITAEDADRDDLRVPGIDGAAAVKPHQTSGVVAWVSAVSRAEFGDGLQQKMENLEWLAEAGVRHQRVVAKIAQRSDILPARFGTVFTSPASLDQHVRERAAAIRNTLERIRGAEEWGVKVFAEPHRSPAIAPSAASGRDYLQKKAQVLQARGTRELPPALDEFARELAELAEETATVGKVSSGQRDLVWQTALLLRRGRTAGLQRLLKKYAQRFGDAYRIEATGPWPPYSFVSDAR